MKRTIYLNGRFLTVPLNGIRRTAFELIKALDDLLDSGAIDKDKYTLEILYSGEIANPVELKHIKLTKRGILKGNLWEQLELPLYTAGKMLINFCTIAPLLKSNQISVIHDASVLINPQYFSPAFSKWYNFAVPLINKRAKHVVTVSEFSKQELHKTLKPARRDMTVMYNAGEHILDYEKPSQEFIDKVEKHKPYCLSVGSLAFHKNFQGLSKALKIADITSHNVLIAGGKLATLETSEAKDNLVYLGYVTDAELKHLYANADLFIFPSLYEGFGIPPLEAMNLGCPVIASNAASMPEVIADAGAYFDPTNVNDMAAKIKGLLNNATRLQELKQAGYDRAAYFNWHKSAGILFNAVAKYV
ncbi:glycosyltransferase family 4 protein [Mucilaginibacter sp. JRF]|uniref:glycosyltransferase family 4 protein n=1 Tax=Mucilaginibacter sp. JRF TaxID=2780088 RepID=UPI0018805E4A|nr:glycosyltransferase family 1 protein [Mucilaginibacter sp. JRF]MBE9584300.1 glycosyltransferase family 4 protein [Mucilaginibacter sp. JRF]